MGKQPQNGRGEGVEKMVASITTSLAVFSITPVYVTTAGKEKIVHYMNCDISSLQKVGNQAIPDRNM